MFQSISSFSIVYFSLSAVLFVLILFEDKLISIEEKIKKERKNNDRK
jgi:hypothetical protein